MYFQKVTQLLSSDGYIFSGRSQYGFRANAHVRQLYCRTTMPTYLYIGENEFFLTRTIKQLKTHTLDQQWANFNYTEYPPESK